MNAIQTSFFVFICLFCNLYIADYKVFYVGFAFITYQMTKEKA